MYTPVPKASARIEQSIKRFRPIVDTLSARDVNEADTVTLVRDFVEAAFGYDKYTEITSEYVISAGSRVDLSIKVDGKLRVHIECKAVNIALKPQHIEQAITYALKSESDYAFLTNAREWQVYRITNAHPLQYEMVHSFNLLEDKPETLVDSIYPLAREGWERNTLDLIFSHQRVLSKYNLAALLQSPVMLDVLQRELKRISKEVKVSTDQIKDMLVNDVLKRDVTEGAQAMEATQLVSSAASVMLKRRGIRDSDAAPEMIAEA